MIRKLRQLMAPLLRGPAAEAQQELPLDLAVAVLLVEMARADHRLDAVEERTILVQLEQVFGLPASRATELLARARATAEDSVSLHAFTRAIHEAMDYAEKQRVMEMLWQVALADRNLDKYEDYLVAKLGELLYVSRGDVIRLKQRVIEQLAARDD